MRTSSMNGALARLLPLTSDYSCRLTVQAIFAQMWGLLQRVKHSRENSS